MEAILTRINNEVDQLIAEHPHYPHIVNHWLRLTLTYISCNYDNCYRSHHDPSLPFPHLKLALADSPRPRRNSLDCLPARIKHLRTYIFPELRKFYSNILPESAITDLAQRQIWQIARPKLLPNNTVRFYTIHFTDATKDGYLCYTPTPAQLDFLDSFNLTRQKALSFFETTCSTPTFYNLFYDDTPCIAELLLQLRRNCYILLSKIPICEDIQNLILEFLGLL